MAGATVQTRSDLHHFSDLGLKSSASATLCRFAGGVAVGSPELERATPPTAATPAGAARGALAGLSALAPVGSRFTFTR